MKTLLAALLLATLAVQTGCVPLGCGAYQGSGDRVFASGQDQLILCENGGFVATVSGTTTEGLYTDTTTPDDDTVSATQAGSNVSAFVMTIYNNDSARIPQFGDELWQGVIADRTSLDHADTLCQGLETQSWWTAQ